MEKEFVPRQLSLELKEIGFNEPCLAIYSNADPKTGLYTLKKYELKIIKRKSQIDKGIPAPTWQSAFRWFREKHNLDSHIKKDWTDGVFYGYEAIIECEDGFIDVGTYNTYEEAELECLNKLIEIIKSK